MAVNDFENINECSKENNDMQVERKCEKQENTLWIYLYRCSKLGPRSIWHKQNECILEEQTRTVCDKAIRHQMERVFIDHSPIKSPNLREKPSDDAMTCIFNMMDVLVASNPDLYSDVTFKLNIATQDERTVCKAYGEFAESLFQKGITWPLIMSLFAFSGSLAAECTRSGRSILVRSICDWATVFTVMRLKDWLANQQGWDGILDYFGDFSLTAKRRASLMLKSGRDKFRKCSKMFIREDKSLSTISEHMFHLKDIFSFELSQKFVMTLLFLVFTFLISCLHGFKDFVSQTMGDINHYTYALTRR